MEPDRTTGPSSPRSRWWLPILILVVAGAAAAGLIASKPKQKPVKVGERAWLVSAERVTSDSHAPAVTLYGRIESLWSSELTAGLAADVVAVRVVEGDPVVKGQVLVELDERDARLQLAQREAELAQADARIASELQRHQANLDALPRERELLALTRSEVARLQDLVKKKVGAQSQLDTARQAAQRQTIVVIERQQAVDEHAARLAEVEAARARAEALRDQAQLELERCVIRAPFNGRVARNRVSPGKRVRTGDTLLELYDTDAMIVRAQLPARYLSSVRGALTEGQSLVARGKVDGMTVEARLRSLAADAVKATGGVDGLFDISGDATQALDQGRFVRLEMTLPAQAGLVALPLEAVYGSDRIYTIDSAQRMRLQKVERVGETALADGAVRLLVRAPGLPDGALVVTTQLPNALDGLLVRIADRK